MLDFTIHKIMKKPQVDFEYHRAKCKNVTFDEKALVCCGDEETKFFEVGDYCLYDDVIIKICSMQNVDNTFCRGYTRLI
jgi:hypothetical protein